MIQVKNLSKRFETVQALDACNLHVPKGAVYGLLGPNGAGKSTLIRHLTGIYKGDSGEVLIDGKPVYEQPAVKSLFAYIPDDVFYYHSSNLRDMMKLTRGLYADFDTDLYEELVKLFDLNPKAPLRSFSKGMVKQAAFILALACRPQLLILDEPVDGLDPVMRRQVWSLVMQEVAQRQTTVLVSSHNLRELEDVCDHVGIMHKGKMLLERSLSQMQENIVKVQGVFDKELPQDLSVLHNIVTGRIQTLILRGKPQEIQEKLEEAQPVFMELMPLNLEEIFIYELGGANYEIKSILL
ncbi:MAG: ABC transporter ATP-binding protein [Oscillospiraceae bacterium]|nr:ABC transporter ATP-binding protein [Oscillospiraceae bacterium]